jgi:hypothetical protein
MKTLAYLEAIGAVVCLVLLAVGLGTADYLEVKYGPETARAGKDTAVHADGLVGESRLAAKNSVLASKDTDIAMKNLNVLVTKFGATADAMTATIKQAGGTVKNAGDLVAHVNADVTKAEKPATETLAKVDRAIDAVTTVPAAIATALAPLPAFEQSLTQTSNAAGDFMRNPFLNKAVENVATLAGNGAEFVDDTTAYFYPPPYTGPHPVRHRFKMIGEGALKVSPGLAGAVALARGN